jgi:hypothetical protein
MHTRARWVTLSSLSRYLGCSVQTLRRHIDKGTLTAIQPARRTLAPPSPYSHGGTFRVYEADVKAYIRQYRQGGNDVPPLPESLWDKRR